MRLDADPNLPNIAKQWKHLELDNFIFDNFIAECGDAAPNRLRSIFNFLSAEMFEYVEECATYDAVIETPEVCENPKQDFCTS